MDKRLKIILKKVDLPAEPFLSWMESNPSKTLPYHNNLHQLEVAEGAIQIADILGFTHLARQHLVVAGLFHDYAHTGNASISDKQNIKKSIDFIKTKHKDLEDLGLNSKEIIKFIKVTEHPDGIAKTISEKAIRDADLLYYVQADRTVEEIKARAALLSEEQGISISFEETIAFVSQHRFHTTPAWNLAQEFKKVYSRK